MVVVALAAAAVASFYLGASGARTSGTGAGAGGSSSSTSSLCHYALSGAVPCVSGYNFTVSVNYLGPWKVTYQGYNSLGKSGAVTVYASYQGSGPDTRNVTVPGSANGWTLCATAQKLDGSGFKLTLRLGGENSTSFAFGSTSFCDQAQLS